MTLRIASLAFVAFTTIMSTGAQACSWPADLYRNSIHASDKVKGSIQVSSVEEVRIAPEGAPTDLTAPPLYKVIHGVVTDRRGRAFNVEYQTAILGCSPFTVPEANATGTFYIKLLESGRYELVHWIAV